MIRLSRVFALFLALVMSTLGAASAFAQSQTDIVDTAVAAGQFTTLAKALQVAGLVDTLKGPGPFTVFAPTDAAFAKLPAGTLDALLKDPAKLKQVLLYHVVAGSVPASAVIKLTSAKTVEGENVTIKVSGSTVMVNNATVVKADVMASNGIIHVIDTVLLPPSMTATPAQMPGTGAGGTAAHSNPLTLPALGAIALVFLGAFALRRRRTN